MVYFKTKGSSALAASIVLTFENLERYTVDTLGIIKDIRANNKLLDEGELSLIIISRLIGEYIPTYIAMMLAKEADLEFDNTTTKNSNGITQIQRVDNNILRCCEDF